MQPWWTDLNEFAQLRTTKIKGKVANALMPGYRDPKTGKVIHRAMMPYGRVWMIPKNLPKKVKRAAFYIAYRISKDYGKYSCPDAAACGMDPYLYSLYSDEAARLYTVPNPYRKGSKPCFSTFTEARKHLDGALANMKVGFPEVCWPGCTMYTESLARAVSEVVAGTLTPEEAINECATEWESIRDKLGRKEQEEYYREFIKKCKELGYY